MPIGNISGEFGKDKRTYKATQSYSAPGVIAFDSKGALSNPIQQIEGKTVSVTKDVTETVLYRMFFGSSISEDVNTLLSELKDTQSKTETSSYIFDTALNTSNPKTVECSIIAGGYLYIITKNPITISDTHPIKDNNTGIAVSFKDIGTYSFTNHYGGKYDVHVYRSTSTFNPGAVTLLINY
jgi:hypothetical protein